MFFTRNSLWAALLILSTGFAIAAPSPLTPWGQGFHWDQLKPQYWQPRAKVLTASIAQVLPQA